MRDMPLINAMYRSLNDAEKVTLDKGYAHGLTQVWYMNEVGWRRYSSGPGFAAHRGDPLPEFGTLRDTHVLLGSIAEANPERVFGMMQGERWSPNGEARHLIAMKGLHHTSMSVGDIIIRNMKMWMVDGTGFVQIGGKNRASVEKLAEEVRELMRKYGSK